MNLIPTSREPSLRRWLLARLMKLINANATGYWYRWKDILLHRYGVPDGFDTQRLEAPCWSCGGTGWWGTDGNGCECCDCVDGVHHVTRTKLWRWQIEGFVFHRPDEARIWNDSELVAIERTVFDDEHNKWHRRIIGRVQHRPTHPALSREAEAWLLLLLGQYRSLSAWMRGAGSSLPSPCWWLPMCAVRSAICFLTSLPARCRRAWWSYKTRDLPF